MTPTERARRLAAITTNARVLAPYSELAREDVPWLIEELRQVTAERDAATDVLQCIAANDLTPGLNGTFHGFEVARLMREQARRGLRAFAERDTAAYLTETPV